MIRVYVGTNVDKSAFDFTPDTTLRAAFEEAGVDYENGTPTLDGSSLKPGDLDKTFASFGITQKCILFVVKNVKNA